MKLGEKITGQLLEGGTLDKFLDLKLVNDRSWLAGGALRSLVDTKEEISDYDMFFYSREYAMTAKHELEKKEAKNIFTCPLGFLYTYKLDGMKIQLITETFYNDVDNLINTFDINACRFAYDNKNISMAYRAYRDVKKKKITLNTVTHPAATMKRIGKYIQKGYKLDNQAVNLFIDYVYTRGERLLDLDRRFYID